MKKIRLDQLIFDQGFAESREKAKAIIMAGNVYINGQKSDKPGFQVSPDTVPEVRGGSLPFVSRGGFKLAKAFTSFSLDVHGKVCIDCGASTGGFTDVLLQNGAEKVYAVDVGYGQLAWKLRNDPRVINMERTNARYLKEEDIPEKLDFAVMDLAFISIRLVIPAVMPLLKDDGRIICLIKPQFEAGKDKIGKKGVVSDPAVHKEVLDSFMEFVKSSELSCLGLTFSPIKGPEGNIEFLGYLSKEHQAGIEPDTAYIVAEAHKL